VGWGNETIALPSQYAGAGFLTPKAYCRGRSALVLSPGADTGAVDLPLELTSCSAVLLERKMTSRALARGSLAVVDSSPRH
jgi:hypothetical protein